MSESTVLVPLTARELVLIRVALMQRLDRLKEREEGRNPLNRSDAEYLAGIRQSYDETRKLCGEKLWVAAKAARKLENSDG